MQLSPEAIEEFKKIYLQQYGLKLSDTEASELGIRLVNFVKAVYGDNLPGFDNEIPKSNN